MKSTVFRALMLGGVLITASCMKESDASKDANAARTEATSSSDAKDPVASAESAAPASIAHNASVVNVGTDGTMTTLRKGSNGWTCMPDSPATPGPDPMCFDQNASNWVAAWVGHKPPPPDTVGLMYMLEGGTDASNTDPYADGSKKDTRWVTTGPHVMVTGPRVKGLPGYATGAAPDTSKPYVMFGGTPYEHLMIPVK